MNRENCDISCGLAGTYSGPDGGKKSKRARIERKEEFLLRILDFSSPIFLSAFARFDFFSPPQTAPGCLQG